MYSSRFRAWLFFTVWIMGAIFFGVLDHIRHSSILLEVYFVMAAIIIVAATRKNRPRNYKFALLASGGVRSPLGFEVRVSSSRLEYVEGDHVVSWQSTSVNESVGRFSISEKAVSGWDAPFSAEPISIKKKLEISTAVKSPLVFIQLVEAGKIRPR